MSQVRLNLGEAERGLPMVCMRCGEEATTTVTRTMRWHPGWVYVLILAHVLIYAVVAVIMTKKATVNAPMCDQHKGHWFYRNLLIWLTFFFFAFIGVIALVLAANLPGRQADDVMPFVGFGCLGFGIVWLIIVIAAQATAIKVKEITDREILLDGVSGEFVDVMVEIDQKRLERRRRRERERWEDEEDEEERPRKKRRRDSSSDGIQE